MFTFAILDSIYLLIVSPFQLVMLMLPVVGLTLPSSVCCRKMKSQILKMSLILTVKLKFCKFLLF